MVDAIALHDHLHALRDVLADPKITKVASDKHLPGAHQYRQKLCMSMPGCVNLATGVATEGAEACVHPMRGKDWLYSRDGTDCATMCQVLHGGDNDVLWLQRDFHLYIVNAFDTEKACQVKAHPFWLQCSDRTYQVAHITMQHPQSDAREQSSGTH